MKLNKVQVQKVAKLANFTISNDEEEVYSKQLSAILDYIEQLKKVDTKDVEPTYNTSPAVNVFREDITSGSLTQEAALENSSNAKNGFFVTKGVFEE